MRISYGNVSSERSSKQACERAGMILSRMKTRQTKVARQEKNESYDWAVLLPLALPPDLPPVILMDIRERKTESG